MGSHYQHSCENSASRQQSLVRAHTYMNQLRASTEHASLCADVEGVRVWYESSEAKQEGEASQEQDDDPITLVQPAANRQVPGQMPQHARFTPQAAPTAEQISQSAPDITGALCTCASETTAHHCVAQRFVAEARLVIYRVKGMTCFALPCASNKHGQNNEALASMRASACRKSCKL